MQPSERPTIGTVLRIITAQKDVARTHDGNALYFFEAPVRHNHDIAYPQLHEISRTNYDSSGSQRRQHAVAANPSNDQSRLF